MSEYRKSQKEIQRMGHARPREYFSPMMPFWLSVGSAALIFLFVSLFPARHSAPLGFSATSLWVALASGTGIFVFLYLMQVVTRHIAAKQVREEICSVCYSTNKTGAAQCPCGGSYEPRENHQARKAKPAAGQDKEMAD